MLYNKNEKLIVGKSINRERLDRFASLVFLMFLIFRVRFNEEKNRKSFPENLEKIIHIQN